MRPKPNKQSLRVGLLIAAAVLPFTPLSAQETQTEPPPQSGLPPVIDLPPPPASQTAPPPAVTTTPAPSADEADAATESAAEAPAPAPSRRTTRATPRAEARAAPAAPAPAAAEPATPAPADILPEAEPVPGLVTDPLPPQTAQQDAIVEEPRGALWPWLLAAVLLVAALALLLVRRRRARTLYDEERYEEPAASVAAVPEPVTAAAVPGAAAAGVSTLVRKVGRPQTAPAEGMPTIEPSPAAEPAGAPMMAAPVAAAAATGRPDLRISVRPLRAGVQDRTASVDFELRIENRGSGPARDVGIATWIYADGDRAPSEAERTLIEHPASDTMAEIGAGDAHRLRTAAALPVGELDADSILPVVVVDVRYRRNDGKEERTMGSFAVGVPLDGELAHFDLENPSGLHEGVEARPLEKRARA